MRRKTAKLVATAILPMVLLGCVSMRPERLATTKEVFPEAEKFTTDGVPQDSFKKAYFEAASDDVFRALLNALTKASLNIEHQDKEKGIILAMKEASYVPGKSGTKAGETPGVRRYSVAVVLEKKSAKGTDVTVYSKVQTSCGYWGPGSASALSVCSFFILAPFIAADNHRCSTLAELQWATKDMTSPSMLPDILRITRENLMNAGLL